MHLALEVIRLYEGLGEELCLVMHHQMLLVMIDLRLRLGLGREQLNELDRFRIHLLQLIRRVARRRLELLLLRLLLLVNHSLLDRVSARRFWL